MGANLRIVEGGPDSFSAYVSDEPTSGTMFEPIGVYSAEGFEYHKPTNRNTTRVSSSGNGAGDGGEIRQNIKFLNWAVGFLFLSGLAAIISSFLILDDRISEKFSKSDEKFQQINQQLGDLRTSSATQNLDVKQILEKIRENNDAKQNGGPKN